jgi:antitoxin CcdA
MRMELLMSLSTIDLNAPKKPANVSINSDLLKVAKSLGINLSRTLEQRLLEVITQARREQWLQENKAALDAYNQRIERDGTFSDGLRRF